jgi:hypothetical protein
MTALGGVVANGRVLYTYTVTVTAHNYLAIGGDQRVSFIVVRNGDNAILAQSDPSDGPTGTVLDWGYFTLSF